MAGLYNICFDENPRSKEILASLVLTENQIERYRDCGITEDRVWIYTRTGGGNREDFPNVDLASHPMYISDEDDTFDKTYAIYWFEKPVVLTNIPLSSPPDWAAFFERMKTDDEFKEEQARRFEERAADNLEIKIFTPKEKNNGC